MSAPLETQVDRTVLSWARTSATVAVVALLFARWTQDLGPIALVPCVLGLVAALLIRLVTRAQAPVRRAEFAGGHGHPPVRAALSLCAISVLLAGMGLLGLYLG